MQECSEAAIVLKNNNGSRKPGSGMGSRDTTFYIRVLVSVPDSRLRSTLGIIGNNSSSWVPDTRVGNLG